MVKRAALLILACGLFPAIAHAHPLHNSYAEIRVDPASHLVQVTVRAFADDFSRHVAGTPGGPPGGALDRRARTYLASAFQLSDAKGRRIPLEWCGWSRVGDQFAMCLRGRAPDNGSGWRIRNAVLMDLFTDQLNIARVFLGSRQTNLLFRPATSTQTIPAR